MALLLSHGRACAMLDLDSDGVSDIWQSLRPGFVADNSDPDEDGHSNLEEMVAGTDPTDSESFLVLQIHQGPDGSVKMGWSHVTGKVYLLEKFDVSSGEWDTLVQFPSSLLTGFSEVDSPPRENGGIYRLVAKDIDLDEDGLDAWEEALLGSSDSGFNSSGGRSQSDYEQAIRDLESEEGVLLSNGHQIPQRLPTASEASRFLVQSTFGPNLEEIEKVRNLGMTAWFDEQVGLKPNLSQLSMYSAGQPFSASLWRHGWWRLALTSQDQLRQRMVYALSQIFVVNAETGSVIGNNPVVQARYYDALMAKAFSSYREVLEYVTYSPVMGFYLSHLRNRKSSDEQGRFPDENFAREVMQLFTIGLWELNLDGTRKLDSNGDFIPAYDNSVITEMAKVFTGMSFSTAHGREATSFYDVARGLDYYNPMKMWDGEHEPGPKSLFAGVVIPDGQTGDKDVRDTLDALCVSPNIAPFVSRLLIQRFTSSNPSPDYLFRVSRVWQRHNGNLKQVIQAILFDPEARAMSDDADIRGKVREPIIRMLHAMRAFKSETEPSHYGVFSSTLERDLGQFPLLAPSVFNFYLPDYAPPGELKMMGLVAPELQIATDSTIIRTHNLLSDTANAGHWAHQVDYTNEVALLSDPEVLLDHFDVLLTYGQMSEATRDAARARLVGIPENKVRRAAQIIVNSPDFSVLK
ncbi:DUF1800 domain-containing protein [Akkermansiaceae bacterium]|nr:DUF1800 domain-containing protein [Akkermansiaceae bacterium]MDC1349857.1 DUF1800 domain-containing protein [Akkermansiaceae bacterium]